MSESALHNGRSIAFERVGSGARLVLVNGLAASGKDWDPLFLQDLAAGHQLILPDNRGTGASDDDGAPFDVAALAADIAAVIRQVADGEPVSLLGWSMGGFIAQAVALDHPEGVGKLVLLSTDPGGPDADLGDPQLIEQIADVSPPADEQARRLLGILFGSTRGAQLYAEVGDLVAEARGQLRQDHLDRQLSALKSWHRHGPERALSSLTVPVFVAAGTEDRVIPCSNSVQMATQIPNSWLLQFAGAGHAFMAEHPQTLARVLNEFLAL